MNKWYMIDFPTVADMKGKLTFIESSEMVPFEIKRVYYIYDMEVGVKRGMHAHRKLKQVMIALNGSFKLELFDGSEKEIFVMNSPNVGIFVDKMVWRTFWPLEENTVILVLASDHYDEGDYIRDFDEFIKAVRGEI